MDKRSQKLMEKGPVCLHGEDSASVEVRRGMKIVARDGEEVGQVAAVVVESHAGKVTHILLNSPEIIGVYRLVPVTFIKQVSTNALLLCVSNQSVAGLPVHQSP